MAEVGAAVRAAVVDAVGPVQIMVGIDDLAVPPAFHSGRAGLGSVADIHVQQGGTS
jgi:hypothetical protein